MIGRNLKELYVFVINFGILSLIHELCSDMSRFEKLITQRKDIQDFINQDYVSANKICGVFARWEKMSVKRDKLTDDDKKVLVWGLTELTKFTAKEKMAQAEQLKANWKQLGQDIVQHQEELQELQQKWNEKVEHAKHIAKCANIMGTISIGVGIMGGVVAAVLTAPAWVPFAAGVAVVGGVGGVGVIVGGQVNKHLKKGIKNKIDDMANMDINEYMTPSAFIQNWVEMIKLLEFPLWDIGLGENDYKPEIEAWKKIAEHEKYLLKTAADTFRIFRDQSLESLNKMRKIQEKLQ